MSKIALAALVLGVFSLSPLAKADEVLDPPAPPAPPVTEVIPGPPAPPAAPVAPAAPAAPVAPPVAQAAPTTAHEELPPAADDENLPSATRDGLTLTDLKRLAPNFSIRLDGANLVFEGRMPRKCLKDRTLDVSSTAGEEGKPGQHAIKIKMPACEGVTLSAADQKYPNVVYVRDAFPARTLDDNVDGVVCLQSSEDNGDKCVPLKGTDGKPISFTSSATITRIATDAAAKKQKELDTAAARDAASKREADEKRLLDKLAVLCKNGDFVGFGQEIEAAKAFLGDVTSILAKVDGLKKEYFMGQIKKAKDADAAEAAYQNYLAAASEGGWDTDEGDHAYADARVDLTKKDLSDSKMSLEDKSASIRALGRALKDANLDSEKKYRDAMGLNWFNLGTAAKDDAGTDAAKLGVAEHYYQQSLDYADPSQKVKVEAEIAKMWDQAADACLEAAREQAAQSGKFKFNSCDVLAKKAKGAMDRAMKAQARIKGDDSLEALTGMKQERLARFGMDGYTMNIQGYGTMNRMGGSYDMSKYQNYSQSQQQFIQQLYMRQQMGVMGMQPAGGTGQSGYFR